MTMDPDEARRNFEESFFWAVSGVLLCLPSSSRRSEFGPRRPKLWSKTDIWRKHKNQRRRCLGRWIETGRWKEGWNQDARIWTADNRRLQDHLWPFPFGKDYRWQNIVVQSFEMNLLTGHIYGEELHIGNYGDIIEFAIPTSINERTLVWIRAGDREWATKSEPNQVSNIYL